MIPKLTFALDSLDLHISKNLVTNLCWLMSKILTVTGLIFSRLWSLLLSVAMLEQMVFIWFYLVFIWLTGVSCNSAAMAQLRIHEGLVFPQPYTFAIFKSGKIFLNNGPKLSAFENGRLCSANIQVTLTSASLSMFEPTATESYIICLWVLLLLKKSTCFLSVRALYNVLILKKRDYSTN